MALRFLPRRYRDDLHAVYAFARGVDEIGDSWPGDRTVRLHSLHDDLDRVWAGRPAADPVVAGLAGTVVDRGLSSEPFHRLVQANLQDQTVTRYDTFEDLLGYCRLSADPVGQIVLGVFGQSNPETMPLSDRVCTALQLLEHWQDVGEDRTAGRIYLPREDLERHAVPECDLDLRAATPRLRALMRFETDRAATILAEGAPILGRLHGWARPSVAGFVAGGQATVVALRRTDGDVLSRAATPSKAGTAARLLALVAAAAVRGGHQ